MEGRDRWAGLSGGPLLANGLIVGIMREVPDGWGGETIEAEPLAPLLRENSDLRALLGVHLPLGDSTDPVQATLAKAYKVIGIQAAAASSRTFGALTGEPLYGRSTDLSVLDDALTKHDRGILLLRGEAGMGKSRLAAAWSEHLAHDLSKTVLRHAFSVREPVAGTRAAMVANLVRQAADALGPESLGPGEPGDATLLADRLAGLLATDRPDDHRLVAIVDGLDEAAEPIEPLTTPLGRGVYVLATCRAEKDEEPRVLRQWRERAGETKVLVLHHTLKPLDITAIAEWLAAATGKHTASTYALVSRAMQASEGIPLFVSYLIPGAIEALASGAEDPFPTTFGDYALKQLRELQDRLVEHEMGRWSWGEVLELFALLSVAKAPLSPGAIRQLVGRHRLDELDQRADRWLWRRAEGEGVVSLAHPRLATVFAAVLPRLEHDIVVTAEERLLEACQRAWSSKGRDPLRGYAHTWLPAQLVELDRKQEAATLLSDGAFLLARLAANPTVATVRATASETMALGFGFADTHPISDWRRFWSETESRVVTAIARAEALGLTAGDILCQLVHDRFGPDAPILRTLATAATPATSPSVRLSPPVEFCHPTLLHTLDRAHASGVGGVLTVEDELVSWGDDGAIRFWTRGGERRLGGDRRAHDGGVSGVLALASGLVSWGDDGAIRFWSLAGEPRPGGDPRAHGVRGNGVLGVLALTDGLVSWGCDGAIRFWSLTGEPRPGGDPRAHEGRALGVLALTDGLVSWGEDGAIRFWSRTGERRRDDGPIAHDITEPYRVAGVLALADGLVSWGYNGIRFWSRDGEPRPGGDRSAHQGRTSGVLALTDGLVSWGQDGAIRLWQLTGEPRPGGDPMAHIGGVCGVLALADKLVSWGDEGAIRFWSLAGEPRPGGDARAHEGGVKGVLVAVDEMVSWGSDSRIRFWRLASKPRTSSDLTAHIGGVWGVRALADGLVSWGEDGAIRFWSLDGEPRPGGDPRAHNGGAWGVLALKDGLVSMGGDMTARFWSLSGDPHSGGDFEAYQGGIRGVQARRDGLVSWGTDGAIRFWSLSGESKPGGILGAHKDRIRGVSALADGLISWGSDGAVRFWSVAGEPRPGGDLSAHDGRIGGVAGVRALPDRLVSWGYDGAIRFWGLDGESLPGGDPKAHKGIILSVLAVADGLVSLGLDGAVRFWSLAGEPRSGTDLGAYALLAVADGLLSWGHEGMVRRWTRDGKSTDRCWIAPTPIEAMTSNGVDVWVGLMGRPHRLLFR
jgi:WD40 repeat protein